MDAACLLDSVSGLLLPDAARQFATAGVAVFPCVPRGKRPLTSHGFRDASADPVQVSGWWSRWPAANIGLPTGVSGLDVVDVDVHSAVVGFIGFERARAHGLVAGWAAFVRTPSGGVHAYFPADPSRPQPSWQAATVGIDFRGTGGYVIAPPSTITIDGERATYELIASAKSLPAPVDGTALRDFLDPRPAIATARADGIRTGADVERLAGWVAARCEGERNRALFWAACRLAESGIAPEAAQATLGRAAERVGLPRAEVATTIHSAYRRINSELLPPPMHDAMPRREPQAGLAQVLA